MIESIEIDIVINNMASAEECPPEELALLESWLPAIMLEMVAQMGDAEEK